MTEQTKRCPECRRSVPVNAILCRYCEHGLSVAHFLRCTSCKRKVRRTARSCRFCLRGLSPNRERAFDRWLDLTDDPSSIKSLVRATSDLLEVCALEDLREGLRERLSTKPPLTAQNMLVALACYVAGKKFDALNERRTPYEIEATTSVRKVYGMGQKSFAKEVRAQLDGLIARRVRECFYTIWVRRELDTAQRNRLVKNYMWYRQSQIKHRLEAADLLLEKVLSHQNEDWRTSFSAEMQNLELTDWVVNEALTSLQRLREQSDRERKQQARLVAHKLPGLLTVNELEKLAESGISLYQVQHEFYADRLARKIKMPQNLDLITLRDERVMSPELLPFEEQWDSDGYESSWNDPDDPTIRWRGFLKSQALIQLVEGSNGVEVITWRILPRSREGAELPSPRIFKIWERVWAWQSWRIEFAQEVAKIWRLMSACQSLIQVRVYPSKTIRAISVPDVIPTFNLVGLFPQEGYSEKSSQTIARSLEKLSASQVPRFPEPVDQIECIVFYLTFNANASKKAPS